MPSARPSVGSLALALCASLSSANSYRVESPDSRLEAVIDVDADGVAYSVRCDGHTVIAPSPIALTLDEGGIVGQPRVEGVARDEVDRVYRPVVPRKRMETPERYRELRVRFAGGVALAVRAYPEGVAYRWETDLPGRIRVVSERATFRLPEDAGLWFPRETGEFSSQERTYERVNVSTIGPEDLASTGLLAGFASGRKLYLSEADLRDYPGMWIRGVGEDNALRGSFVGVALETDVRSDRSEPVAKHADYLAETAGKRTFPWRVMIVADDDAALLNTEMIDLLAPPQQIDDASWVRPGKVAWDWWNALNITGVDFESGPNNATYRHYIDFAAENGIEYVVLDEGWSDTEDLLSPVAEIDVRDLIDYAAERDVKIILWVIWRTLDRQLEEALAAFTDWGAAGIKVDFMDRDDQWMVNFYHRVAREAAERRLLVDFHGSYKPTGLRRAYPNVITREGVRGLEWTKFSDSITPEHNVTIPFIRMVAGPMDYTPGAMRNANPENWSQSFERPVSKGTRCHQLAMYAVYESPLQMLCDSPTQYRSERECLEFLAAVPTVWEETEVLAAKVSDYVAIARRSGDRWFVGAMTDGTARELELSLDFLTQGEHRMRVWSDGVNSARHAEDYCVDEQVVTADGSVVAKLAAGGGWAAIIEPVSP